MSNPVPIMEQGPSASLMARGPYDPTKPMIMGSSSQMDTGWRGTPVTITKTWKLTME